MRIRQYEYVREQAASYNYPCDEKIASSETIAKIMRDCFKIEKQVKEHFYTITLDTKLKITGVNLVSVGNLDSSPVHPREVFTSAIATPGTAAVVVVHNHPSGDATPSAQDIEATARLAQAADILGIKLIDHIIVAGGTHTSFKANGLM